MKNLWIKIAWVAGMILSVTGISRQMADACQIRTEENQPKLLLAQNTSSCQQLEQSYQEVHTFETQNFYINVCRYQQRYYYHRKSKHDPDHSILLPANTILDGNMFQARDRGKTYIVGTNDEGYYSSVMHENNEIIFEPAIEQSTLINNRLETEIKSSKSNQSKQKCADDYSYIQFGHSWKKLSAVLN